MILLFPYHQNVLVKSFHDALSGFKQSIFANAKSCKNRIFLQVCSFFIVTLISNQLIGQEVRPVLHVIQVVDSKAENVGTEIGMSGAELITFSELLPPDMYNRVIVIKTDEIEIVNAIRNLKTQPNDTIIFYYIGHGNYDSEKKATWLDLSGSTKSRILYDFQILQELKMKDVRLGVVILDCCNREMAPPFRFGTAPAIDRGLQFPDPLADQLFFKTSGLIMIQSSAPNEYAIVKAANTQPKEIPTGSIFTSSFLRTLKINRFGRKNWTSIMNETQYSVDKYFLQMTKQRGRILTLQNGAVVNQERQTLQINFYR
jgi:hypothetical protein